MAFNYTPINPNDYRINIGTPVTTSAASATNPELAAPATMSAINAGKLATAQLPGYMTSMGNIGNKITSETAGEVPQDVINLLQQQGAEGNAVTGAAGNASYLKALGLTSLGLQEQGQKDLESILPTVPGYATSQNVAFQTSAPLQYEKDIQQQIFQRQDVQQGLERQMQQEALEAAKSGLNYGGSWGNPTNAWSGVDAFGFPSTTTATLPGQTSVGGVTTPWTPGGVAYGGSDTMTYNDLYGTPAPPSAPLTANSFSQFETQPAPGYSV